MIYADEFAAFTAAEVDKLHKELAAKAKPRWYFYNNIKATLKYQKREDGKYTLHARHN